MISTCANAEGYWDSVLKTTQEARERALKIHMPLEGATKTSSYGLRNHPILQKQKLHRGMDLMAEEGTPFYSAGKGIVLYAEERGDLGNTIAVEHPNGSITRYGHLSAFFVKEGDQVEQGAQLGFVGSTGNVTAAHLHFELIIDGEHVDPETVTFYEQNNENLSLEQQFESLLTSEQKRTLNGYAEETQQTNLSEPNVAEVKLVGPELIAKNHNEKSSLSSHELTTWQIASQLVEGSGYSVNQALAAILKLNPSAFKEGDINFRFADVKLIIPTITQIAEQSTYTDTETVTVTAPN